MNQDSIDTDRSIWRDVTKPLQDRTDFIRIACVLEATAPKVGNVHPNASFHDLTYDHFMTAAECTAVSMAPLNGIEELGPATLRAVQQSRRATGTNVNLGIVLLLGPLLASEPSDPLDLNHWQTCVTNLLANLEPRHGGFIATAIANAEAGGMKTSEVDAADPLNIQNVRPGNDQVEPYDIMKAMRQSADRDRIALQYAHGFADLFDRVVPTLRQSVLETRDLLPGIVLAHIRLIAESGDSLIARKGGNEASSHAQRWAKECLDSYGPESIARLDTALRGDNNCRNPGTTADLIAAGLYVCLRSTA